MSASEPTAAKMAATIAATHAPLVQLNDTMFFAPLVMMKNTLIHTVMSRKTGSRINASLVLFLRRSTAVRTIRNMMSVMSAAASGERNHEMTIGTTPPMKGNSALGSNQTTALLPPNTSAKPMMPPMIECVVETGSSRYVASRIQTIAPVSAQSMPNIKSAG